MVLAAPEFHAALSGDHEGFLFFPGTLSDHITRCDYYLPGQTNF